MEDKCFKLFLNQHIRTNNKLGSKFNQATCCCKQHFNTETSSSPESQKRPKKKALKGKRVIIKTRTSKRLP